MTVEATNRRDVERLLTNAGDLAAGDSPKEAILEFADDFEDMTDESRQAIWTHVRTRVRHLNGAGKLRWGAHV